MLHCDSLHLCSFSLTDFWGFCDCTYRVLLHIFIQSIFHTTQKKSDSSYFKNEVINERNAAIAQLADGKTIFYLDLNPLFDDENGALRADYSGDGVHVRAPYYVQWRDHLYQFGVVK